MDPSCSTPSPASSPIATLDSILVKVSFLVHLSADKFDPENSEMRKFTQLARSANPYFCIIHKLCGALLDRQIHQDAPLQLVIPQGHGFH